MITIKNARTPSGTLTTIALRSSESQTLDAKRELTVLPALIDPHVHFRTPGHPEKETWVTGSQAAIAGGVTTVFDMPNNNPACVTAERLKEKKSLIEEQLAESGIPLRYHLYFGADSQHLNQLPLVADQVIGVKIYMGSTTGTLLMDQPAALLKTFQMAAELGLPVGVHAECEECLRQYKTAFTGPLHPRMHPKVRDRAAAIKATKQAIELAAKTGATLIVLHLSTKEELDLIRQAKKSGLSVYAETTPQHLCMTAADYESLGTFAQMNPPIRSADDKEALWQGIRDRTIDTIGSDHAPHTVEEKNLPYGQAPSGIPGVETTLPLLLDAVNQKRLTLDRLVELTSTNIQKIYGLPETSDCVLVNMNETRELRKEDLKTKCGWSPFVGRRLKGWPTHVICRGQLFNCRQSAELAHA